MRVCVLASKSFIGSNILRKNPTWTGVTRNEVNLLNSKEVENFFDKNEFDWVINCAAVGGSRLKEDDANVLSDNIVMFENITKFFKGKTIHFSSGAALRGDPPRDPYGFSKYIIDQRIKKDLNNAYILRIWGCYGPGEKDTRFSAICKNNGHVEIEKDRYFDFIDVDDVVRMVELYVTSRIDDKEFNLVYPKKYLLSEWAEFFGATYTIKDKTTLDDNYIHGVSMVHESNN